MYSSITFLELSYGDKSSLWNGRREKASTFSSSVIFLLRKSHKHFCNYIAYRSIVVADNTGVLLEGEKVDRRGLLSL